jgi:Mg-chelatase subunit ChlD
VRRRLPVADTGALDGAVRRTAVLGLLLAAALVLCVLLLVVKTRHPAPAADILPAGATGVVVLDLSGSTRSYPVPIATALRQLTEDGRRRLGLVVFSDAAYLALPTNTPVEGLRGWLDAFEHSQDPHYAWSTFSGGTNISAGLQRARHAVLDAHLSHPHVLLVSDLVDDDSDLEKLASTVEQYQRDGIDLRVISVTGLHQGQSPLQRLTIHNAAFVAAAASKKIDPFTARPDHTSLIVLAVLVALLAAGVAALELGFHPLDWGKAT